MISGAASAASRQFRRECGDRGVGGSVTRRAVRFFADRRVARAPAGRRTAQQVAIRQEATEQRSDGATEVGEARPIALRRAAGVKYPACSRSGNRRRASRPLFRGRIVLTRRRRWCGEVPERSNGAVSKTVVPLAGDRGFESLPLRQFRNVRVASRRSGDGGAPAAHPKTRRSPGGCVMCRGSADNCPALPPGRRRPVCRSIRCRPPGRAPAGHRSRSSAHWEWQ